MDLNLIGPINQLGYGIATLNILKGLIQRGHKVAFWPKYGQVDVTNAADLAIVQQGINNQAFFNKNAPSLNIWHQFDLAESIGYGVRHAMTFFELDEFTAREKHHLDSIQKLFVTCKWAQDIVCKEGRSRESVPIVPLGVDTKIFNPDGPKLVQQKHSTRFLAVGKWEVRKGHDILPSIFDDAFSNLDNYMLVMACHNPFIKEHNLEWRDYYKNSNCGDKIVIFDDRLEKQEDIAQLMRSVDCGIFLSRAEAWNFELLEMMACGKPVIATNYSGHTAYVNSENSYLVDIDSFEEAYDGVFFKSHNGVWASFGPSQFKKIVAFLRQVHEIKQGRREGTLENSAGLATARAFSWDNCCAILEKELFGG